MVHTTNKEIFFAISLRTNSDGARPVRHCINRDGEPLIDSVAVDIQHSHSHTSKVFNLGQDTRFPLT